jgi:hypothetical protein
MSENKNKSDQSDVFTLQIQDNQNGDVPDIDQLLSFTGKQNAKPRAATASPSDSTTVNKVSFQKKPEKTSAGGSLKNLKGFGTKLEVHFLQQGDDYRYIQHSDHSKREFFGLDDLFQEMKIPQKFMQDCGTFGEFSKSQHGYLFDAFGIQEVNFLQFVCHQQGKIVTVYASNQSMADRKDEIIAYTEAINQNLSASSLDLNAA